MAPEHIEAIDAQVRESGTLRLAGVHAVPFERPRDLRLLPVALPYHPNALRLRAHGADALVDEQTYHSVGGGFVVDEAQARAGAAGTAHVDVPYPLDSAAEMLALCRRHGLRTR